MMPGQKAPREVAGFTGPVRWKGRLPEPSVRDAGELAGVLADPQCPCTGPVYYMYRDVARTPADREWLHGQKIRFDITVIPPRDLCGEWMKTKGHYHPESPSGTGYPEIYEVLEGEAHYLLQSSDLRDVILMAAEPGDLVIIPPGYGHVTINPSPEETLSMANIVSTAFGSEYGQYEARHGAAYYELTSGRLARNQAYPEVPSLRRLGASCARGTQRICKGPLYDLVGNSDALRFLNFPEQYAPVFEALLKE